jgi:hypothetical protein
MYSETDRIAVLKQLKKTAGLILGVLLLFLIVAFVFMTQWPTWIGTVFLLVGVCFSVFFWGIYGTPTLAYYRFVRDIVTGRSHEVACYVKKVSEEPVYKDNKLFYYEVWVDEEGIERVLLYDMNKGKPEIVPERDYTFKIHENYIIDVL